MSWIIETFDLTKKFDQLAALDAVTIKVEPGIVFGFLGPNGAGKTTMVRMLNGLLRPTHGKAVIFGKDIQQEGPFIRSKTGVQTDTNLYEKLSAKENLEIWGSLYGLTTNNLYRRIDTLLEMFSLAGKRDVVVGNFSKGMKQKLAIARALIHDPEILFLDEPTAGLDPEASEEVILFLQKYIKDGKRTVFLCSHRLDEVERLSQAIAIIYQGRILANGTIEALRNQLWKEKFYSIRLIEAKDDFVAALKHEKYISQVVRREQEIRLAIVTGTDIARAIRLLVNSGAEILSVQEEEHSLKDIYFAIVPKGNHEQPDD